MTGARDTPLQTPAIQKNSERTRGKVRTRHNWRIKRGSRNVAGPSKRAGARGAEKKNKWFFSIVGEAKDLGRGQRLDKVVEKNNLKIRNCPCAILKRMSKGDAAQDLPGVQMRRRPGENSLGDLS